MVKIEIDRKEGFLLLSAIEAKQDAIITLLNEMPNNHPTWEPITEEYEMYSEMHKKIKDVI